MSQSDLDNLLRSHFAGELDRQRGRTARAFQQQVIAPLHEREETRQQRYRIGPAGRWTGIGVAVAACAALAFTVPAYLNRDGPSRNIAADDAPRQRSTPIDVRTAGLERTTVLQNIDQGPALLQPGYPARRIRQQRVDRYRWVDPETKAQYELTYPSEQELLIEMQRQ